MSQLKKIAQAAALLKSDGTNIFFTGAGISTESGIPDYRSKGGIWEKFQPIYFQDFMNLRDARVKYWHRKAELYEEIMNARPNQAHLALLELYNAGLLETIITQNIDGLHQQAGIPVEKVIELHGNTRRVRCMRCGALSSIEEAQQRILAGDLAPECSCGGYLKPDTISFGQAMPEKETRQAAILAESCSVFIVIGSTLLVHPAADLPKVALQNGAALIIINLSETPYDSQADILINGKAGEILPQIVEQIQQQ